MHYARWLRNGTTDRVKPLPLGPEASLEMLTLRDGDCLIWTGSKVTGGYGQMSFGGGRSGLVHRWVYEQAYGPIPDGMEVDHVCHNRACVELAHLRLATRAENTRYRSGVRRSQTATGVRNVRRDGRRFRVRVPFGGEMYGGAHDTLEAAAAEAELLRVQLYGEFAGAGVWTQEGSDA